MYENSHKFGTSKASLFLDKKYVESETWGGGGVEKYGGGERGQFLIINASSLINYQNSSSFHKIISFPLKYFLIL